jgi:hypothetical protein
MHSHSLSLDIHLPTHLGKFNLADFRWLSRAASTAQRRLDLVHAKDEAAIEDSTLCKREREREREREPIGSLSIPFVPLSLCLLLKR